MIDSSVKFTGDEAEGAFHDSGERFDPPKCHPGTRETICQNILSWVQDRSSISKIMWLYGPAGAGYASFFFSRTAPKRNSELHLFSTIAYQLAMNIPCLKVLITQAVEADSTIFTRDLLPLLAAIETKLLSEDSPQLIIIDALDECDNPQKQLAILKAAFFSLEKANIPQVIRDFFFGKRDTTNLLSASKDIELFLSSKFKEIKESHTSRPFPDTWPSKSAINTLLSRSSGQFIYASTIQDFHPFSG
ncbi:hypothetical protein BDQ12DRAFT_700925 [Crucibulum laeve]|uniref:Nephrocystin 3-like N-terminal domain-containing protein n=1 Tax=Crucibulum laeve TaxID=68775 RepID=A0A5C3LJY4_9AGAR|nr:hypothetical protein BDQ12DRAFT_700925 [Crucibulum laeve]